MKKIIVFDLDGTLLNTLEDLADSTNYALKKFNYPQRSLDEIRDFVGNGVKLLIERAIPRGSENPDFESCLNIFKEHYSKNMYNKTRPYPGILEMLQNLRQRGCKIAVVSNKFDTAVKELCIKYFESLIDVAIGENEAAGISKKPAPDTVFKAIFELGATVSDAVYVGDSDVDIQTAQNSFIPCISVTWGFRSREFLIQNRAKILIDKPEQIFEHI